jgi:peptide/nickel transport system substrate-binding protein
VKWQNKPPLNGRQFAAGDVKFAYERMKTQGVAASFFAGVTAIEAFDPTTLKVTLDKPLVDWLTINPPRREAPVFPKETVDDGSIARVTVGTSAFIVDKQETQRMTFVRNPDWWGAPPHVDGGEIRSIVDLAARVAALRTSQVDQADNVSSSYNETKSIVDTIPGA